MGVAFIRDEGLPPLYIWVEKVFAEVSRYFGSVIICKLAARSGLLSRLPSPPTVPVRHGTARTTAISPGAFHPAFLSHLGNEQVQVQLRDRTHSPCHHQQPYHPNHDLHPPSPAPVGSILSSPILLRLHRQCSLARFALQRPPRHRPLRKPLHSPPFPNQPGQALPILTHPPPRILYPALPTFANRIPDPPSPCRRHQTYLRDNPFLPRL